MNNIAVGQPPKNVRIVNSIRVSLYDVVDKWRGINIIHITHNDADAWGCAEILRGFMYNPKYWVEKPNITLARNNIRTVFSKVEDADKNILEAIEDGLCGDTILFISDLRPMSPEVLKAVTDAIDAGNKIYIIDHHEVKDYETPIFEKYKDNIYIENDKYVSAALAMFNILAMINGSISVDVGFSAWLESVGLTLWLTSMSAFAVDISNWDTWAWSDNRIEGNKAQILNMLVKKHGVQHLYDREIVSYTSLFPGVYNLGSYGETARYDYDVFYKEVNEYLSTRKIRRYTHDLGFNIGVIFAEKYTSEMAEIIFRHPDKYKALMFVDMNSRIVSLRGKDDDTKILDYAILNKGGGHKKACGFKLKSETHLKSAIYYFLCEYGLEEAKPTICEMNTSGICKVCLY